MRKKGETHEKNYPLLLASILSISTFSEGMNLHASEMRDKDSDGYRYYSDNEIDEMIDDMASTIDQSPTKTYNGDKTHLIEVK